MRFFKLITVLFMTLGSAGAVAAQEREGVWVKYTIEINNPVVEGVFLIAKIENGQVVKQHYPLKKIARFIAEDCAAGKIGKIELGKQTQKRRRGEKRVMQYFQTTCSGGIRSDYRGSKYGTTVIVEKLANGKDEATYQFSRLGDLLDVTKYR